MKFDGIVEKSKDALKFESKDTFAINCKCTTQEKAKDFYRNAINKILSTLTESLSIRFSAIVYTLYIHVHYTNKLEQTIQHSVAQLLKPLVLV